MLTTTQKPNNTIAIGCFFFRIHTHIRWGIVVERVVELSFRMILVAINKNKKNTCIKREHCMVDVLCMFLLHLFGTVVSVQLKTLLRSHQHCVTGIRQRTRFYFNSSCVLFSSIEWCCNNLEKSKVFIKVDRSMWFSFLFLNCNRILPVFLWWINSSWKQKVGIFCSNKKRKSVSNQHK